MRVRGLTKSFGANQVLKGIDLDVMKGQVVSVIGASGSGKTTLLRCVAGLTQADSGAVERSGDFIYAGHLAGVNDSLDAGENW